MSLISLGEPLNSLQLLAIETSKIESLSQLTQTLEAIREQRKDGTQTSTFTTQMTSSSLSIKLWTLEIASS